MQIENLFEVRGHARGGQGMVTAFEILAKIFSHCYGYEVQAFPFFGVERTGAPIQAFLRVSKENILVRSNVYQPNLIVIFDEGLIAQNPVFDGLSHGGAILINTEKHPSAFKGLAKNIFTVPATKISVENGLGSKALPLVNASMIGAMLKILEADIALAKAIIASEVPSKPEANAHAAEVAFNSVEYYIDTTISIQKQNNTCKKPAIEIPKMPYWDKPMSLNKTGNWRVISPSYAQREAPCSNNCPAGTDVRAFIKLTSEKKYKEAYEVIYEHNPFPSVCGRVCPHFCQQNCNRISLDEQVNIGAIERFLGDFNKSVNHKKIPVKRKEKIAVIGAGPAGLTAALHIRKLGYEVTVFEALPFAGGMMRAGIPEFRLPEKILNAEIKKIEDQGVKIVLNKKVSVKELEKDFSSIIVSAGSHIGSMMNIPNEELIIEGISFLRELKINSKKFGIKKGDQVAIIGGGNTAIDVARTVLRLGAMPTIYYRRTKQEMPAIAHEVEEAIAEGVKIEFLSAPVGVKKNRNNDLVMTLVKMKLGKAGASGRRKPLPVKGSEKNIKANKIIKAIGQSYDDFVFEARKVKISQGKIIYESKIPVFCAGDMAWGGTVTEAIGSGNEVALEMDHFFRKVPYKKVQKSNDVVTSEQINHVYYLPTPGNHEPMKKIKNLYRDFSEVVQGLTKDVISEEAGRCLHCGDCFECGNCFNFCPDAAIHIDESGRLRIDYDYCKGCGICMEECPCSAIKFVQENVAETVN